MFLVAGEEVIVFVFPLPSDVSCDWRRNYFVSVFQVPSDVSYPMAGDCLCVLGAY
jgi:hypothetical protein